MKNRFFWPVFLLLVAGVAVAQDYRRQDNLNWSDPGWSNEYEHIPVIDFTERRGEGCRPGFRKVLLAKDNGVTLTCFGREGKVISTVPMWVPFDTETETGAYYTMRPVCPDGTRPVPKGSKSKHYILCE